MPLNIIQQEIYTGSINIKAHSMWFSSLSPSAPHLTTPHLTLHRIGCKHIPSYFAFPIVNYLWIGIQEYKQNKKHIGRFNCLPHSGKIVWFHWSWISCISLLWKFCRRLLFEFYSSCTKTKRVSNVLAIHLLIQLWTHT